MGKLVDMQYEKLVRADAKITRLSTAETAKLVRAALKHAFPGQAFSVRSRNYAGGSSIDVEWTDGPTSKEVDAVTNGFEGAQMEGVDDYKGYKKPVVIDGQLTRMGTDWVSSRRNLSYDLLLECAEAIAEKYGCPMPEVTRSFYTYGGKKHESVSIDRHGEPLDRYADGSVANYASTAGDKALQLAYATSKYERPEA